MLFCGVLSEPTFPEKQSAEGGHKGARRLFPQGAGPSSLFPSRLTQLLWQQLYDPQAPRFVEGPPSSVDESDQVLSPVDMLLIFNFVWRSLASLMIYKYIYVYKGTVTFNSFYFIPKS